MSTPGAFIQRLGLAVLSERQVLPGIGYLQLIVADAMPGVEHAERETGRCDNGSAYMEQATRDFAMALNRVTYFTPVASPESNGMSEAFVNTL